MFQYRAGQVPDSMCQLQPNARDAHANGEATILALLDNRRTDLNFGQREIIFQEGDRVSHFYRLARGKIQLSKRRLNDRRQIVRLLLPGDLFGFEVGDRRRLSAESLDRAVVSQYPSEVFEQIGDNWPDLHRALMELLRDQLFFHPGTRGDAGPSNSVGAGRGLSPSAL